MAAASPGGTPFTTLRPRRATNLEDPQSGTPVNCEEPEIGGARWGLDTAEAILTLRATVTNGDFNDYWRYHQQQEHHRTYPASTTPTTLAA